MSAVATLRRCFADVCMPSNSDEASALAELDRRELIEARRDAYGREHCVRYLRGGIVEVEYETGAGRALDYLSALEDALDDSGAP